MGGCEREEKTPALLVIVTNFSCQTLEHKIIICLVVSGQGRLLYDLFR